MSIVLITGSSGLVGSESVNFFSKKGFDVIGIDNDLRKFILVFICMHTYFSYLAKYSTVSL